MTSSASCAKLCGPKFFEQILDDIIDRKERLKRLVELKSKVMVTAEEHEKFSTWS
jgi:hypothetical protein